MRKFLASALCLLVIAAAAIEPQAPPSTAPKSETPTAEDAEPASETAENEELPPLPPEAAAAGPSPQRFNPTEKVRADFPVSFPIDI